MLLQRHYPCNQRQPTQLSTLQRKTLQRKSLAKPRKCPQSKANYDPRTRNTRSQQQAAKVGCILSYAGSVLAITHRKATTPCQLSPITVHVHHPLKWREARGSHVQQSIASGSTVHITVHILCHCNSYEACPPSLNSSHVLKARFAQPLDQPLDSFLVARLHG